MAEKDPEYIAEKQRTAYDSKLVRRRWSWQLGT